MNKFLLGAIFICLIVLETTIINLPLAEVLVIVVSLRRRPPETFYWAFFVGLFLNLFSQQTLGGKSLFLLAVSLVAGFFSKNVGFLDEPVFGKRKIVLEKEN